MWRTSPTRTREYLGGDSYSNGYRRLHGNQRTLTEEGSQVEDLLIEEDTLIKVGDALTEENTMVEDPLIEVEGPLEEENTLVEDPLMEEEGPLMEEDPLDLLEDKDHQALKDPLDQ